MEGSKWTDYTYQDLNAGEVRLLDLQLDHEDDRLIGTLRCWQAEEKDLPSDEPIPPYWALSHHWDPQPETDAEFRALPILLLHDPKHPSGKLHSLRLRQSLAEALKAVRDRARSHRAQGKIKSCNLWIDAICINQLSADDKTKQLGRMGNIYNDSETVIVWLGLLNDQLETGMKFVRELQNLHKLEDFLTNDKYQANWHGLVMLSRNPWFQRLWIVQEIAATERGVMLAGHEEVKWSEFESAWSIFVFQFERVRTLLARNGFFARLQDPFGEVKLSAANVLVDMRGNVLRKSQTGAIAEHRMTLEHLLTSLAMFEVTEPRDVVYAVLWLSSDANTEAKHKRSMRHEFQDRTPDAKRMRTSERLFTDMIQTTSPLDHDASAMIVKDPLGQSLSPHSNVVHRSRAPSISGPFLQVPATKLELSQAIEAIHNIGIKTDYKQPVFDLCKQVLLHIIERTERLDIICYRWAPWPGEGEPQHPSWLLFTKRNAYKRSRSNATSSDSHFVRPITRNRGNPFIGKPGSNKRPYLACGRTRVNRQYLQIDGRILRVMGWILGEIEYDGGEAPQAVIPWKWRRILGWTRNEESPPEHFWRTLVADKGPDDQAPPMRFRLACKWAFERGANTDPSDSEDEIATEDKDLNLKEIRNDGHNSDVLKEFLDCAIATIWKRKLFKTRSCPLVVPSTPDSAFVGLGPAKLETGDIVAVLWGCAVPVILRPKNKTVGHTDTSMTTPITPAINLTEPADSGSPSAQDGDNIGSSSKRTRAGLLKIQTEPIVEDFEFIGECYVHGMMNGEIFHWAESHGRLPMDFNLH